MILQLDPMLPVVHAETGERGFAFALIDYSQEHDLLFVCGFESGEIWTLPNTKIRLQQNISLGRHGYKPPESDEHPPY